MPLHDRGVDFEHVAMTESRGVALLHYDLVPERVPFSDRIHAPLGSAGPFIGANHRVKHANTVRPS